MIVTPMILGSNEPVTLSSFNLRSSITSTGTAACGFAGGNNSGGTLVEHWHTGQFAEPDIGDRVYTTNDTDNPLGGSNNWFLANDVTSIRVDFNGFVIDTFICNV